MNTPLRVLLVEDQPADADLMLHELRRAGIEPDARRVETEEEYLAALEQPPDLILSDFTLPGFNGLEALRLIRGRGLGIPFLFVSATMGEDLAVSAMHEGADDYLIKDRLGRLGPAVRRALEWGRIREERVRAEQATRQFAAIVESSADAIISATLDCVVTSWNPAAERLYGWRAAEVIGRPTSFLVPPDRAGELAGIMARLRRGDRVEPFETVRLHRDGTPIDVAVTLSLVRDHAGAIVGVSKIARDIRDRKRAEEAVRASEARFRAVVEKSYDGVVLLDAEGTVLYASPSAGRIGGRPPEAYVGRKIFEFEHPDDAPAHAAGLRELVRHPGSSFKGEGRLLHDDGRWRWIEFAFTNLLGDPAVGAVVVNFQDVTEWMQAEAELRRTGGLLRAVADGVPDAVFVKDRAGRYLLFNDAAARFVGWAAADVLGRDDTALFSPDDARQVMDNDRRVMDSNRAETREEELTAAGATRIYLGTKAPYRDERGQVIGILGISHDITYRRRTEDALREKEAKLAEAARLARMGHWSCDLATGVLDWSDELYVIFGVDPAAFGRTFESFLALLHPDDRESVREHIADAEATGGSFDHTYRILVGGEVRVIHEVGRVTAPEIGKPPRIAGTAQDVTEWTRAEEALRLRDRAISAATQGIVIADPSQADTPIVYASPGFERLTGYSEIEVLGRNCRFLQGKDTDPDVVARVRAAVREGRPCHVELLNYKKDGTPFWSELSIAPVRDDRDRITHFIGLQTDATQRRSLEDQYHHAQKMDAVGQLAGGVAHDFNNLLTIIYGYSELLLERMAADDPGRPLLAEIHKAGERSAALTRQLLVFSRKQVVATKVLDLNEVVADAEKMLRRLIGEDVRLETALGALAGRVKADPGQLEQVLMNLAVNARDAMPRGGRLTIGTSAAELDESYAEAHAGVRPGRYALLAVSDTGSGMTEAVRAKIFEPFFTTKEVGKGTGLGLAVVHGIVKEAGGHVGVSSEVGVGTTFEVYLPLVDGPTRPSANGLRMLPAPRGTETVLLVEDEDGVRALTRHVLAGCGYSVLEAVDGDEALRVAGRHGGRIDLLVTDVVMPGLGGRLLAERILASHPEAKVLFVSGYTDDAVVRHGILEEEVQFLQKPFSPLALAVKVREVLDSQGQSLSEAPLV